MERKRDKIEPVVRLAICAGAVLAVIYAAEQLWEGKGNPLWEKYGPWLKANRVQAAAIGGAVLYGLWTALEAPGEKEGDEGYRPCGVD